MSVAGRAAVGEARAALIDLGGPMSAPLADAIERLPEVPAFAVMVSASGASRPQWAGMLDDLFERSAMKAARLGLRNALASTLAGDALYRNVFFSFVDAVALWYYAHTGDRRSGGRIDFLYRATLNLLNAEAPLTTLDDLTEPDAAYFRRLRRVQLTGDDAYPLLRRAGRLLGTVESGLTDQKARPLRGSLLTSYLTFSAQVIAMARALRQARPAIGRADAQLGLQVMVSLIETPPVTLGASVEPAASPPARPS